MKKISLILIMCLLVLTGCGNSKNGNKVECSVTGKDTALIDAKAQYFAYLKEGVIDYTEVIYTYDNKENFDKAVETYKLVYGEDRIEIGSNTIKITGEDSAIAPKVFKGLTKQEFTDYIKEYHGSEVVCK